MGILKRTRRSDYFLEDLDPDNLPLFGLVEGGAQTEANSLLPRVDETGGLLLQGSETVYGKWDATARWMTRPRPDFKSELWARSNRRDGPRLRKDPFGRFHATGLDLERLLPAVGFGGWRSEL